MKDRIRQLMLAQHMNQQTFAKTTGLGSASLSSIFTGRTRPTMNHVLAILDTFPNVNPVWLIRGQGGMLLDSKTAEGIMSENSEEITPGENAMNATHANIGVEGANMVMDRALGSTDNMADTMPLFSSFQMTASDGVVPAAKTNVQHAKQGKTVGYPVHADIIPPKPMAATAKRITEITVFYDDKTWETFVPKK